MFTFNIWTGISYHPDELSRIVYLFANLTYRKVQLITRQEYSLVFVSCVCVCVSVCVSIIKYTQLPFVTFQLIINLIPFTTIINKLCLIDENKFKIYKSINCLFICCNRPKSAESMLHIDGFRVEHADKDPTLVDGVSEVKTGTHVLLRLYGSGITSRTVITFTKDMYEVGGKCDLTSLHLFKALDGSVSERSALFEINFENDGLYFICAKNTNLNKTLASFEHQGNVKWLTLRSATPFLPFGVQILIISICLCFSALFSGLNLGLMSLDRTDLKVSYIEIQSIYLLTNKCEF